ncbi:MAG: MCE family protein, partial [Candidatus Latescibacteria bacterium]|nr:MCE family protein [Candidatus Latescibacterota bacterium]
TDAALFRARYKIQTVVKDAGGIRRGDPVQMRGVNIGRVTSFRIMPEGVAVTLEIEGEYLIPTDSQVELRSSGLLGGMVANVVPGTSEQEVGWGDVLPGTIGKGVFDQIDELQSQADMALIRVQKLLDEQTIQNVHEGGDDLRRLLRQLNEVTTQQRGELVAITGSLRRASEGLEKTAAGPQLSRAMQRIDTLTEKLDSTAAALDRSARSAESILARMDRGEGTLGKLSRDEALYDRAAEAAAGMKKAAEELAGLAADIRAEPKKYIHLSIF